MAKYKKCTYCLSRIPAGASKCRFCQSDLGDANEKPKTRSDGNNRELISHKDAYPELIRPKEVAGFFSPEYIAHLKLVMLTSARPDEKIEAARKIVYSTLSGAEKSEILLRGLLDEDPHVRAEIVVTMRSLGLDADVSLAIQSLSGADAQKTMTILHRLRAMIPKSGQTEVRVIMVTLLALIKSRPPLEVIPDILDVLDELASTVVSAGEYLKEILRLLFDIFSTAPTRVIYAAKKLIQSLYKLDSRLTVNALFEESEKATEKNVRIFALTTLSELDLSAYPAIRKKSAAAMVEGFVAGGENWRLGSALVHYGADIVDAVIKSFDGAADSVRMEIIRVLDRVAAGKFVSKSDRKKIATFYLGALRSAPSAVRSVILETALIGDKDLPASLQKGLVPELLRNIPHQLPDAAANVEYQLVRMGVNALSALLEYAKNAVNNSERLVAMKMLGQVAGRAEGDASDKKIGRDYLGIINYLQDEYEIHEVDREVVAESLAEVCRSSACPKDLVGSVGDYFLELAADKNGPAYSVKALARLAPGPNCPLKIKRRALFILLEKFWAKLPDSIGRMTETSDGPVFEITDAAQLEGVVLPAAINGLAALCVDDTTSADLRQHTAEQMLKKWQMVGTGRVAWTPMNSLTLIRSLGIIGSDARLPKAIRLGILKSLKAYLLAHMHESISVIDAVRRICEMVDDPEVAAIALDVLQLFITALTEDETYKTLEESDLLLLLARMAVLKNLDRKKKEAEKWRRRALNILYDALLEGTPGAAEALTVISGAEHLPKKMREEVQERVTKYFGLVAYRGQD